MGRRANLLVGIDHENPLLRQGPPPLAAPMLGVGRARRHLLSHLLDRLLDVAGVPQDPLETFDDVGVVADVALHDVDGVIENVVDREGDRPVDRLDTLGGRRGLLGDEELQGVEGRSNVTGENLEKLHVGVREAPRLGALDVERPDHLIVKHERDGERALRPLAALEIAAVFGRVVAEIAPPGGCNISGDAVVFGAGVEDPGLRLRLHPLGEKRLEAAGLPVEEADLDDVEEEQITRIMENVALEEVDPLLDRHVGQFSRREVGELLAGLMDGGPLLLLEDRVGDVADADNDMVGGGPFGRQGGGGGQERGGVEVKVAVVGSPERGTGDPPRGEGGVKRAELRAEDLRVAQRGEKPEPAEILPAAPLSEAGVCPADRVAGVEEDDAVGEVFQDALGSDARHERPFRGNQSPGEDDAGHPGTANDAGNGGGKAIDRLDHGPGWNRCVRRPGRRSGRRAGGVGGSQGNGRQRGGWGDRGPFRIADDKIAG